MELAKSRPVVAELRQRLSPPHRIGNEVVVVVHGHVAWRIRINEANAKPRLITQEMGHIALPVDTILEQVTGKQQYHHSSDCMTPSTRASGIR